MELSSTSNVEKLLQDLQSKEAYLRKTAAEELGKVSVSNARIVRALISARDTDSDRYVSRAAAESLLAPAHQAVLQQPEFAEENARAQAQLEAQKMASQASTASGVAITRKQAKEYNRISLAIGLPGLVIQVVGAVGELHFLVVVGSIMFLIGLAYYAKAKGRSGWWGLLGLLSWIGLIILAMLPDKSEKAASE